VDAPSAAALNITLYPWGFKLPGDDIRQAVADAARGLCAADPQAHVFYEERQDVRATLGSDGFRNELTTDSRGGAVGGRTASLVSESVGTAASRVAGRDSEREAGIGLLEDAVVQTAASATSGRQRASWSAKLVAFHQEIWVGRPGMDVVCDARQGCRIELRARVGISRPGQAVEDLVVRLGDPSPIMGAFTRVFERAEERGSAASSRLGPGEVAGVLAPGVAGVVAHELIGHALEGDVVSRGQSWLASGGSATASADVAVTDDPRRGRGAWKLDDEGTATGETHLIVRGRTSGLLLDSAVALALGKTSTGHGRRASHLDRIQPRMGCTFIEAGADDPEEILRATRSGVFIRRLTAGHTDPVSGRATFLVSDADRIIDGALAGPLDDFVIELDGVVSWASIDRIAHDLAFDTCVGSCVRDGQPLAVSVGAPTIRIGVMRVCC
jgi:hypothetical protein